MQKRCSINPVRFWNSILAPVLHTAATDEIPKFVTLLLVEIFTGGATAHSPRNRISFVELHCIIESIFGQQLCGVDFQMEIESYFTIVAIPR